MEEERVGEGGGRVCTLRECVRLSTRSALPSIRQQCPRSLRSSSDGASTYLVKSAGAPASVVNESATEHSKVGR